MKRTLAVVLALLLCGCPDKGKAAGADVTWADAGPRVALGASTVSLPKDDLADGAKPALVQDDQGKRFAYPTKSGDFRLLYKIGDDVWLGPTMKAPLYFEHAPKPEDGEALGPMFENATGLGARAKLAADVKSALGDKAVARMLAFAAEVYDPVWDAAYAQLDAAGKESVRVILTNPLIVGKPTYGLRRAVVLTPLTDAARAAPLEKRIQELLAGGPTEPAAVGVMIRALAVSAKSRAASVGCEALKKLKMDELKPGTEILAEAATLAIANDVLGGAALACKDDVARALADACVPQVRCAKGAPLTGHETSDQDEPLCTKEELAPVVGKELARTPADTIDAKTGTRKELFAYAALLAAKALPDSFVQAHERRRYAIAQPDKPACESGLPLGTPCHCSEPELRDHACRGPSEHPGICKSEVDDKAKKISNVVTAIGQ